MFERDGVPCEAVKEARQANPFVGSDCPLTAGVATRMFLVTADAT
jgi:hypothetical protein